MSNSATTTRGMFLGATYSPRYKYLHEQFKVLFDKAQKEIKGPEWPPAFVVDVACCEDFEYMKFKYRIRKIYPIKRGAVLSLIPTDDGFTVPIVAQDEMEAMKLTMQVMDKYTEECNGNI